MNNEEKVTSNNEKLMSNEQQAKIFTSVEHSSATVFI